MLIQSLTIATRESPLALWQAHFIKNKLLAQHPDLKIKLLELKTTADKMLNLPLDKVGGKGLFVKELEEALLDRRADIAVHSMKDVPMELPNGLCIPVMIEREEARDAWVSSWFPNIKDLKASARIGTSSLRRQSQLLAQYPDLQIIQLRGNVNTRLRRLDSHEFDGIILAAAGLHRLNLNERIASLFSLEQMLPAAAQGILGIECRTEDKAIQELITPLQHTASFLCATAERALCKRLGGNCQVPVGAYAEIREDQIFLTGLVARPDGKVILRALHKMELKNAEELGVFVGNELLKQGAELILSNLV